jgi:hypothetical protein
MKWLLLIICLLPIFGNSQIVIDDVGDNWKLRVDSALQIVKKYDLVSYGVILDNCKKVSFWTGSFSTVEDSQTILITQKDMKHSSINNIAAILVHESTHLKIMNQKLRYTLIEEEIFCYHTELEFLRRIPNVEDWLINNTKKMILYYERQ